MNTRHISFLRLVIEHGTITAAARQAGVSQPAISQALQALERELGIELFSKQEQRIVPTAAALAVAKLAVRIDALLDEIKTHQQLLGPSSDIRLGMSVGAALQYGPGLAEFWYRRGSTRALHLTTGAAQELLNRLEAGELDAVVCPRPRSFSRPHLSERRLFRSDPRIYVRKGHPRANATSLAELEEVGWIVVGREKTPGNMIEEAFRVRRLKPPRIVLECADYLTMMAVIQNTDFFGIVPSPIIANSLGAFAVEDIRIVEGLPQYEVCLFLRGDERSVEFTSIFGELANLSLI